MNLKKSLVSFMAASALVLTSAAGVLADDSSTQPTHLNVTCPVAGTVELTVNGAFSADATSAGGATIDSDLLVDNFELSVDMNCDWSTGWYLNASITDFEFESTAPVGTVQNFDGDLLTLSGGEVTGYDGPTVLTPLLGWPIAKAPNAVSSPVWNFPIGGAWSVWIIVPVPHAAPGISTFEWDGQILDMPANLAEGQYTADLTIDLVVP